MALLSIGDTFPAFDLVAVKPGNLVLVDAYKHEDYFMRVTNELDYEGQWTVVFFWPKNFSIVCPTEIMEFARHFNDFDKIDTRIIGVTTDNEFSTFAWRKTQKELQDVPFPLASDLTHEFTLACGVLNDEGVCDRATYIIDPEGKVRSVSCSDTNVGRSVKEVLRQLSALQTHSFCVADWKTGQQTINPMDTLRTY